MQPRDLLSSPPETRVDAKLTMEEDLPLNHLGATIFWLYILAALFFSIIVLHTLTNLPSTHVIPTQKKQKRNTLIFSILAALSFATLSVNMLNVLIQSFASWSAARQNPLPTNPVAWLEAIWHWSVTSTLFQDFAQAIVLDRERYTWASAGLLATFLVCLHVGVDGERSRKSLPGHSVGS